MKKKPERENRIPLMRSEKIFYFVNGLLLTCFLLITLYPILNLISRSISSPEAAATGRITFYPVGFSLEGFLVNLQNKNILTGLKNTVIYCVLGVVFGTGTTLISGFALSRRELMGRTAVTLLFSFTMWFSGGLIPSYLLVRDLGLYNTRWAIILPGMVNVWNIIVCRTNINSTISEDMFEAASMDGCSYWRFFRKIVIPLCKPVIAVIILWDVIGHWNAYFNALLYLQDKAIKPLQLFLRDYLVQNVNASELMLDGESGTRELGRLELVKNSLILLSVLPLWLFYPFIQKFFVKGVMVGAVKG